MNILLLLAAIFAPLGTIIIITGFALTIIKDDMFFLLGFGLPGFAFLLTAIILWIVNASIKKKKTRIMELKKTGIAVMGQIQRVYMSASVSYHYESKTIYPYFIDCLAVNPVTGEQKIYRSDALFYNPSGFLKVNSLPVYFDLQGNQYHVDTSPIIPEETVLHKFKSGRFNSHLINKGQRITATVIGTELTGYINIASLTLPVKLPKAFQGINFPIDEFGYTHLGYSVLCAYTDPTGQLHIFASKDFWGKPERDYTGMWVNVYVNNNYQNYYVDSEQLGIPR